MCASWRLLYLSLETYETLKVYKPSFICFFLGILPLSPRIPNFFIVEIFRNSSNIIMGKGKSNKVVHSAPSGSADQLSTPKSLANPADLHGPASTKTDQAIQPTNLADAITTAGRNNMAVKTEEGEPVIIKTPSLNKEILLAPPPTPVDGEISNYNNTSGAFVNVPDTYYSINLPCLLQFLLRL